MGTQLNYNIMREPVFAIMLGISLGMALSVIAQKIINAHAIDNCWRTPNRQVVYLHLFQGDAWYCVDKQYLK